MISASPYPHDCTHRCTHRCRQQQSIPTSRLKLNLLVTSTPQESFIHLKQRCACNYVVFFLLQKFGLDVSAMRPMCEGCPEELFELLDQCCQVNTHPCLPTKPYAVAFWVGFECPSLQWLELSQYAMCQELLALFALGHPQCG